MPREPQGTFRDDRGAARVVKAPVLAVSDERMGDPKFALAVRRGMTFKATFSRKSVLVLLFRFVPVIVLYAVAESWGVPFWLSAVVLCPIIWLVNRTWPPRIEDTLSPRLATHWLGIGLCPCCLYGLMEIPPSGDGIVICPECGGSWKAERLHGPGHFHSNADGLKRGVATVRACGATFQQGIFIKDARGIRVPMAIMLLSDRLLEVEDPELKDRLEQGVRKARRSGRFLRWTVAGMFAALGVFVLVMQLGPLRGPIPRLTGLTMAIMPVLLAAGVLWGDFGYNHQRIARALLKLRLCPSCGADMQSLPVDADRVTCRCSAIWKVRPARSFP